MKKLGLIINPKAGKPGAANTAAVTALHELKAVEGEFELLTYPGEMGADAAKSAGIPFKVIGSIAAGSTTADDTKNAARQMMELGVELILFSGGDGTARDMLEAVGDKQGVMGIPVSPEVLSSVYAATPVESGVLAVRYIQDLVTETAKLDVIDCDESGRQKLLGFMSVLNGWFETKYCESIAEKVLGEMEPGRYYIMGKGIAPKAIMEAMGIEKDPMTIDVVKDKKLVTRDADERQLLDVVSEHEATIITTIMGREGLIFEPGDDALTPEVLKRVGIKNVRVLAIQDKIVIIPVAPGSAAIQLKVNTGDSEADQAMRGYTGVITCANEKLMLKVV